MQGLCYVGHPLGVTMGTMKKAIEDFWSSRGVLRWRHAGLIHRDIKPENVVVVRDLTKLTDKELRARRDEGYLCAIHFVFAHVPTCIKKVSKVVSKQMFCDAI